MRITRTGYDKSKLALNETLFHTANGYIGVRASPEEGAPDGARGIRGAYINAFYDTADIHYGEKLCGFASTQQTIVNVADVQGVRLTLGGEPFDPSAGELIEYTRALDMRRGAYERRARWRSPKGRESLIVFTRMASFTQKELFVIHIAVTPVGWCGDVRVESSQLGDVTNDFDPADPRKLAEARHMLSCERVFTEDGDMLMLLKTARSGMQMASAVRNIAPEGFSAAVTSAGSANVCVMEGEAVDGRALSLTKYCIFTDSRRHDDPLAAARELIDKCAAKPFACWEREQSEYLADFWAQADIEVRGDAELNESLHYCAYSLLSSCGTDGISSIASKGLSGEGYEGHYFWDTEIYMFPFFLLTQPDKARALLDYRAQILDKSKEHARLLGHMRGALYAWRTIDGEECSAYYPSGSAQYHINADVAHAFIDYWLATGDDKYMCEKGLRVLIETSRLWLDVGHYERDGLFRIDCVTGPDEYTCLVNNNFYTNRAAKHQLEWTARLCELYERTGMLNAAQSETGVTREERDAFARAAESMYLPYDKELNIRAQDDSFLDKARVDIKALPKTDFPLLTHYHPMWLYRRQVCKQADAVLAHFLYEQNEDEDIIRATYDYYEPITTHDSSLSECVFSMMAARVGDIDKAYDYYARSACLDLEDTHGNTRDGIHAANMGGAWMGVVYGFGGLRIDGRGLSLRPCLPREWEGYSFGVAYRGARLHVDVSRERVAMEADKDMNVTVYGREIEVCGKVEIPIE